MSRKNLVYQSDGSEMNTIHSYFFSVLNGQTREITFPYRTPEVEARIMKHLYRHDQEKEEDM